LQRVPPLVAAVLAEGAPSHLLFHQANRFMLNHLVKKCGVDPAMVPINIERFGNCSSASIPLLMCDPLMPMFLRGLPARLALFGFGAGWAWAGASLQVEPMATCQLLEV
jgi:3-oxoacyl-[acyl-carrier-protein] synthase-3